MEKNNWQGGGDTASCKIVGKRHVKNTQENRVAQTQTRSILPRSSGIPEEPGASHSLLAKLSRELAGISKKLGADEGDREAQIVLGEYAIRQMMQEGRIKTLPWPKQESGRGFEHVVLLKGREVYKFTNNEQGVPSGYRAVSVAHVGGVPRVVTGHAAPSEYLERWDNYNHLFRDLAPSVSIEGAAERPDGTVGLVVKQEFVPGEEPTMHEIAQWLESEGFVQAGSGRAWYRPTDGAALTDVKPDNFRKLSDQIIPLDIPITFIA
jgi:hypothetical protein